MSQTGTTPSADSKRLFDDITAASYYGLHFRQTLIRNPEAMKAAEVLAKALRDAESPAFKGED